MRKKLLCFDLDNTLIKSNSCHLSAYQKAFKRNHIKKISSRKILANFGKGSKTIVKAVFPKASNTFVEKIVHDHDFFVRKETCRRARRMPGARETLQQLRKRWQLALVSNCNHKIILALLKATNIPRQWFKVIVGNDEVIHPKPAPDEIVKAERLMHLKAEYMVGDSIYDIRAAKRAKVKVIAIPSGIHSKKVLARERPTRLMENIKELARVL